MLGHHREEKIKANQTQDCPELISELLESKYQCGLELSQ